jgi:phospholipase C
MDTAGSRRFLAVTACLSLLAFPSFPFYADQTETVTPFKHVIIVMQENHSFDNYFGTYPTANGTLVSGVTWGLTRVNGIPEGVCAPYGGGCVAPHLTTSSSPVNPVEGQATYEADYAPNSNFANSSGPQSMVYFDYHSLAGYWDYAEEYGLADNYFAAALSQTTPNRLLLLAGDTPVSTNYGPPPYADYNATIFGQLDGAGVSWGYYDLINASENQAQFYPLNYISGLEGSKGEVRNISSLLNELGSGSRLPSVAFVNLLGNLSLTEHPPFPPQAGEAQVISIVDAVMNSPYWDSTAVFLTWDEGGGFYDHVTPPSLYEIDHGFSLPLLVLGQRVPLLVISPYSKVNYVSHQQLSHLSLLHFVEFNWNLPSLNDHVARASLPMDFFNFTESPRPKLLLGAEVVSQAVYPIALQEVPRGAASPPSLLQSLSSPYGVLILAVLVVGATGSILVSRSRSRIPRGGLPRHRLRDSRPCRKPLRSVASSKG